VPALSVSACDEHHAPNAVRCQNVIVILLFGIKCMEEMTSLNTL